MSEATPTPEKRLVGESGGVRVEAWSDSPVVSTLSIEVEAKRVRKAFDRAYRDIGKTARVRGFRPGKVPRKVLEKLYGASLPEEIERSLVAETLGDAIELAALEPLVQPEIEADPPTPDAAFTYRARVELKPEVELPPLDALRGERPAVSVADDAVEERIESLRQSAASLVEEPEGTEAAEGHTLTVDFVGRIDGEPFEGGSAQGVDIELGAGRMIPGFEDGLLGARSGDDAEVDVTFPDDYGNAELAGRAARFDAHVVAVRRREVPELDDELAKDLDADLETLDDLRAKVRRELEEQQSTEADQKLRQSLLDALVEATDFDVPAGVVEQQLQHQLRSLQQQFQGQVPPELLQAEMRRMSEEGRDQAERRVREAFLLEAVAEQNDLSVADDEVDDRLAEMAASQGLDPGVMKQVAESQGWRESVRSELRDRRALDFLASRATVETAEEEASP